MGLCGLIVILIFLLNSSGGKTGLVPGSVMMRSSTLRMLSSLPSASQLYCKDMNVFNPPPRR